MIEELVEGELLQIRCAGSEAVGGAAACGLPTAYLSPALAETIRLFDLQGRIRAVGTEHLGADAAVRQTLPKPILVLLDFAS